MYYILDQLNILRRIAKVGKARSESGQFDPLDTFIHLLDEIERTRLHIMNTDTQNDLQLAEVNTNLKKLVIGLRALQDSVENLQEINAKLKASTATLRLRQPFTKKD